MFKIIGCVLTLWVLSAIGVDGMLTWMDRVNARLVAQLDAYEARTRPANYEPPSAYYEPPPRRHDADRAASVEMERAMRARKRKPIGKPPERLPEPPTELPAGELL